MFAGDRHARSEARFACCSFCCWPQARARRSRTRVLPARPSAAASRCCRVRMQHCGIAGDDGVVVVDTCGAKVAPQLLAAVQRLSGKPIRFVINTHEHGITSVATRFSRSSRPSLRITACARGWPRAIRSPRKSPSRRNLYRWSRSTSEIPESQWRGDPAARIFRPDTPMAMSSSSSRNGECRVSWATSSCLRLFRSAIATTVAAVEAHRAPGIRAAANSGRREDRSGSRKHLGARDVVRGSTS